MNFTCRKTGLVNRGDHVMRAKSKPDVIVAAQRVPSSIIALTAHDPTTSARVLAALVVSADKRPRKQNNQNKQQ
jgi:hypothetical protein